MSKNHDMQPQPMRGHSRPDGQPVASIHEVCKNGCGLQGQPGGWMNVTRGVLLHNSELRLDQIPCDPDYPPDSDENWTRTP